VELPARAPWIWPLHPPAGIRELAWTAAGAAERWSRGVVGIAAALAIGAVPALVAGALRLPGHQVVSSAALVLLCLACVRRDEGARAVALVLLAFAAHSVVVLLLAGHSPESADRWLPGASDYWIKQRDWIRTGWDPEYETPVWVSAHAGQLGAVLLSAYGSLGGITFAEGFREVDWMNFYTVQLMRHSASPALAVLLGWHVWSLVRGAGLAVITVEVVSLSLGRLTGRDFSTTRTRQARWAAGLSLLVLDGVLKVLLLRPVQEALLANLR
jgi:hypothetical protein